MKLVIDLQGAQTNDSRNRGIGRYSLALTKAMLRKTGEHNVWIALNNAFLDTIEPIRAKFDLLLPQDHIVVWEAPNPVREISPDNGWRRRTGEILRESFLASLKPDMVHVSSLFEGIGDNAITSVGAFTNGTAAAVTLYDLIPLIHAEHYLIDPTVGAWYRRKLTSLRRAGLWLSISESSRQEGISWLNLPAEKVANISTAADPRFRPIGLSEAGKEKLRQRYGLSRPFVMYTGGIDYRKNIEGLIEAYALLDVEIRRVHQLAIVCFAQAEAISTLRQYARKKGLDDDEMVLTGFVSDEDLVGLYNICSGFCFPSTHEGFGLPALEAMQCGAATIGSNVSSIPEVIGRVDALFDPYDKRDIARRLHRLLTDANYRTSLTKHGLRQARKFSWEESARRAWAALEAQHSALHENNRLSSHIPTANRHRLAYVSPLPPQRSGIANYSAELLPELARHYDIDVIVAQPTVADPWITANCAIRDTASFEKNAHHYDRILYHFGNSAFHQHMFDLLERHPGIVVLHDFYLSGILAHLDVRDIRPGLWAQALYESHGFHAVIDRYHASDITDAIWKYPANLRVLKNAVGVIVHSNHSRNLAEQFYGEGFANNWTRIPLLRSTPQLVNRQALRSEFGFKDGDFVLCSFGMTAPTKLSHRLVQAWSQSNLAHRSSCHLVFVGEEHTGAYGAELRQTIEDSPARRRIHITGYVTSKVFQQYLSVANAAVQLRTLTRGETSAAIFDCMAHGLPTIVNAHGACAELPKDCVVMLSDELSNAELVTAIEELHASEERGRALGTRAQAYVSEELSPRRIADEYVSAIERYWARSQYALTERTVTALAAVEPQTGSEIDWLAAARAMNRNFPLVTSQRQLLVDISEFVLADPKTEVQRVTRNILTQMLFNPPPGYRVEPVYAIAGKPGYRYARKFTMRLSDCPEILSDALVELRGGDIFLSLNLAPQLVPDLLNYFSEMRRVDVKIYFVIYDLLPLRMPEAFVDGLSDLFALWISTISVCADGIIGISRATADELVKWLKTNAPQRTRPLNVGSFHLGADTDRSLPTYGLPDDGKMVLANLSGRPTFLVVGTIEPRKKHEQVLMAFERLWARGIDANLVIVGNQGLKVETLIERLREHPELGKRLFWLDGISEEYLEKIYAASACLIAASEAEGFDLPLIEAARNKLPILARNIPVFREIAGRYAYYFDGSESDDLACVINDWLALFAKDKHPKSDNMPWLTWAQSADDLKAVLLGENWYVKWFPAKEESPNNGVHSAKASDIENPNPRELRGHGSKPI